MTPSPKKIQSSWIIVDSHNDFTTSCPVLKIFCDKQSTMSEEFFSQRIL